MKFAVRRGISLMAGLALTACVPDVSTVPSATVPRPTSAELESQRKALRGQVERLEFLLSKDGFAVDKALSQAQLASLQSSATAGLVDLHKRLERLDRGGAATLEEIIPTEPPTCAANGTLDECYSNWYNSFDWSAGRIYVYQSTLVASQHTMRTDIVNKAGNAVDGGDPEHVTSTVIPLWVWSDDFPFTKPDCSANPHEIYKATTNHTIVEPLPFGLAPGIQTSITNANCAGQAFRVTLNPSTIAFNGGLSVANLSNMPADCNPSLASANTSVARLTGTSDVGTWYFMSNTSPGQAKITASCVGTSITAVPAYLTVTAPPDSQQASITTGGATEDGSTEFTSNCRMMVDVKSYDNWVTYTVISSPYRVCEGEQAHYTERARRKKFSGQGDAAGAVSRAASSMDAPQREFRRVKVTLVEAPAGVAQPPVVIRQDKTGAADATIVVDLDVALPSTLAGAINSVTAFMEKSAGHKSGGEYAMAVFQHQPSGEEIRIGAGVDRLSQLKAAAVRNVPGVGRVRSITMDVEVPYTKAKP